MAGPVRLLDATLRDGSYCVDFQFTAADTGLIVGMLDAAGVGFIELGHGSGTFNHKAPEAFRSPTRQAASDEDYLAAARKCATRAKLGIITGPFGTDDLEVLARHRFDFVRLACMADRALEPANLKMAERARSLGLTFSVNLMQTIAIPPSRIGEIASAYAKAGAGWFYIVDSSGGMLPRTVAEYVARACDTDALTIGFHAHHNSGLAIANCVAAIEAGATMVDGTLQGLGRDVGNAVTEQLLLILRRYGHEREIDVEQLCHVGDLVRGLLLDKGNDPTYFASGVSEIHSSNVPALVELARQRGLGPRSLLAAIAQGDTKLIGAGMKTFPEAILGPACARATHVTDDEPRREIVEVLADDILRASTTALPALADVLFSRAAKWHKKSVLHLVPREQFPFPGPLAWDFDRLCGYTVGVKRSELDGLDFADRAPNVLMVDPALSSAPLPGAAQSYVDDFIPVVVESALTLATICHQAGSTVWMVCSDPAIEAQLAARADRGVETVRGDNPEQLVNVAAADTVIVVGFRDLPQHIAALAARGTRLLRPALATTIATHIASVLDVRARLAESHRIGDLVDPIFIPTAGQVVVDDPQCPSTVVAGTGEATTDALSAARARARTLARGRGRL